MKGTQGTDLLAEEASPFNQQGSRAPEVGHIILIKASLHGHYAMQHLHCIQPLSQEGRPHKDKCRQDCEAKPSYGSHLHAGGTSEFCRPLVSLKSPLAQTLS